MTRSLIYHPHLVYPSTTHDSTLFIRTEQIHSGTLVHDYEKSSTDAIKTIVHVTLGMTYLYYKEVHYDNIKPVNVVMVDQEKCTGIGDEMSRVGVLVIVVVVVIVVEAVVVYCS
jgi:hypothetical protein